MDHAGTSTLLETAVRAAREAGTILLGYLGNVREIETKNGQSINLVTEADRASEAAIVKTIRERFPSHAILGEEGGAREGRGDTKWIIDPLDGTTNFTHGLPVFSVSIGIERSGEIIAGVVFNPATHELFVAEKGSGAYLNGSRIRVSEVHDLGRAMLVTGFPYDVAENPDWCHERFIAFLRQAQAVRRLGSAALDCAFVAAGRFDGFWEVALQPWDKAAGVLLISEAGGTVSDFEGEPQDLFAPPFLGTNGLIHAAMIDVLAEAKSIRISQ